MDNTSDVVRIVAQSLAKSLSEARLHASGEPYRHDASKALEAIRSAGYVVVPVEPTARMCVAGANERDNGDGELHRRKWRAMIAAAEGGE